MKISYEQRTEKRAMAATQFSRGHLMIKDENLGVNHNKDAANAKGKNFTAKGKGGKGGRKALNDITNKPGLGQGVTSRRKDAVKEEFNPADEMFLHDHRKCIEDQKRISRSLFLETVFPGDDADSHVEPKIHRQEADPDSSPELDELSELFEWLDSYTWKSPPPSPVKWESPPSSPLSWDLKQFEFKLKPEAE